MPDVLLTPAQVAALRALEKKAAAAPWDVDEDTGFCGNPYCTENGCLENHPIGVFHLDGPEPSASGEAGEYTEADAVFIAKIRNATPALLLAAGLLPQALELLARACMPGWTWNAVRDQEAAEALLLLADFSTCEPPHMPATPKEEQ